MRSRREQEDFLEQGQFGEGEPSVGRTRVDRFVWLGLLLIAAAGACFGSAVLFQVGRDDGRTIFVMGSILALVVGVTFCVVGIGRTRSN